MILLPTEEFKRIESRAQKIITLPASGEWDNIVPGFTLNLVDKTTRNRLFAIVTDVTFRRDGYKDITFKL